MLFRRCIISSRAVVVEELALFERLLDGLLQVLERVLVPLAEVHVLSVEAAFEEEIGERLQQVLGADAEVLAGVPRVVIHFMTLRWMKACRSKRLSCTAVGIGRLAAALLPRGSRRFFFGREAPLFVAADAAVRVQAFQNELGRRRPHGIRLVRA